MNETRVNGHALREPKRKPGVRPWEPDDADVPAGQFEFRLLDCEQHGTRSFFRRYGDVTSHRCLMCYVDARREVYVRAAAGKRVVVETRDGLNVGHVDVPLDAVERVTAAAGKRVIV